MLLTLLDLSWMSFVISCSPGQAARQNLWSTPYGFRFQPAGAVTKINDLIFVVLAEWQQLCPRWLTLSTLPCLTLSSKHWPKRPGPPPVAASHWQQQHRSEEQGERILRARRHGFHPTGVRTSKAVSKCAERIPCIPPLSPGGPVWCWVPGREGRGAGVNVSRLSSWHLLWSLSLPTAINQKCRTFQQGGHINTALSGASINMRRLFIEEKAVCCGKKPRMSPLSSCTSQSKALRSNPSKLVNVSTSPISFKICFFYTCTLQTENLVLRYWLSPVVERLKIGNTLFGVGAMASTANNKKQSKGHTILQILI